MFERAVQPCTPEEMVARQYKEACDEIKELREKIGRIESVAGSMYGALHYLCENNFLPEESEVTSETVADLYAKLIQARGNR